MSEISSNVKTYALIVAIIGLSCLILSFTFGFYPFLNAEESGVSFKANLFGKGEVEFGTFTIDIDADDWDAWSTPAAWVTWIGFLVAFLAAAVYYVVSTGMLSLEALEGQNFNLSLGMLGGSAIAFLGMVWWMMGTKTYSGSDVDLGDTGLGAWFHLILALGITAISYSVYTEERDSA
ncbi:MAG: hypothetical protein ACTSYA_02775 [Candidatus Kariarchaeaceae archaeon]